MGHNLCFIHRLDKSLINDLLLGFVLRVGLLFGVFIVLVLIVSPVSLVRISGIIVSLLGIVGVSVAVIVVVLVTAIHLFGSLLVSIVDLALYLLTVLYSSL